MKSLLYGISLGTAQHWTSRFLSRSAVCPVTCSMPAPEIGGAFLVVFLLQWLQREQAAYRDLLKNCEGHEALVELALPSQPPTHPPGVLVKGPAERLALAGLVGW